MERLECKFASEGVDSKTGTFAGYASVFGVIDSHGDIIHPGAFSDTLGEWGRKGSLPTMKLMHGSAMNPFTGSDLPMGKWLTMREDPKGLYAEGKLSGVENTDQGRYNYELMKDGALNALSIGYKTIKFSKPAMAQAKRNLEAVKLFEVSLVPEGSNASALVTSLKSAEDIKTIREFEDFLRDVGGYSHAAAKAIAAGGFKASEPRDEDEAEVAAKFRRNLDLLTTR